LIGCEAAAREPAFRLPGCGGAQLYAVLGFVSRHDTIYLVLDLSDRLHVLGQESDSLSCHEPVPQCLHRSEALDQHLHAVGIGRLGLRVLASDVEGGVSLASIASISLPTVDAGNGVARLQEAARRLAARTAGDALTLEKIFIHSLISLLAWRLS
jgi:hypothetical protein